MAGCVKTIQTNLGITEVAGLRASCAKIRGATKTRILFFYPSIVRYSLEEENRQLEKLHLTRADKVINDKVDCHIASRFCFRMPSTSESSFL
jgi:hypothetical protein